MTRTSSSPMPIFTENISIPTLLIRKEDSHHFIGEQQEIHFHEKIWIASKYESVANPDWFCDYNTCLPLKFNQGYLIGQWTCL